MSEASYPWQKITDPILHFNFFRVLIVFRRNSGPLLLICCLAIVRGIMPCQRLIMFSCEFAPPQQQSCKNLFLGDQSFSWKKKRLRHGFPNCNRAAWFARVGFIPEFQTNSDFGPKSVYWTLMISFSVFSTDRAEKKNRKPEQQFFLRWYQ